MKKALDIPEIEEILTTRHEAKSEPPENLLEMLKKEIPEELGVGASDTRSTGSRRPLYLMAATLFLAVVAAVVTTRVRDSLPEQQVLAETAAVVDPKPEPDEKTKSPKLERSAVELEQKPAAGDVPGEDAVRSAVTPVITPPARIPPSPTSLPPQPSAPPAGSVEVSKPSGAESRAAVEQGQSPGRRNERTLEDTIAVPGATSEAKPSSAVSEGKSSPEVEESQRVGSVGADAVAQRPEAVAPASPPGPASRAPRRQMEMTQRREIYPPQAPPSTGGTAEPNDQPYGDMFFRGYGTNPFVDTEVDSLSTFGLDVDSGSFTMARSYIQRGDLPPADAIRVEEFVNYFDYRDRPPRRGDFSITAEGAPSPFSEGRGYRLIRFGLHGREIHARDRKPAVLTFVVDVSGSMNRENRLGLVKRSLHLLLDELAESGSRQPGDRVGLVIYGSRGEVLLEPSTDHGAVRRAIDRLAPGGSTNAEEGLVLGYRMARRHFRHDGTNRVILCSDGVANVGRTGPESILEQIEREAEFGIELTTVGFGMGNYNDVLMEQLADRGDGRYAYVDSLAEARRLFVDNLTGTLETIASDAKVQVEFDPRVVSLYRLVGYENRDVADERFRDDTVDAGEIGAGHQVTALYEIKLGERVEPTDRLATLRLRYRSERTDRVEEKSAGLTVRDLEPSWRSASPSLRLAAVVAEFAEILKGSYWAKKGNLWELAQRARPLVRDFRGNRHVAELVDLIEQAARIEIR